MCDTIHSVFSPLCILHTYTQGHINDFSAVFGWREGEFLAMWETIQGGKLWQLHSENCSLCRSHRLWQDWLRNKKALCNGKECETIPVIRECV